MADLGEFGRAVTELVSDDVDTFRFHGERFELPAAISSLVPMRFTHAVKQAQTVQTSAEARTANAKALRARARTADAAASADAQLESAQLEEATANTAATAAMYEYIRGCLGDDAGQWARFESVCLRDGVQSEELMDLCARIFEAVGGRPTRRLSDSSDGPSNTGATSTDGAGSPEPTPGLRVITAQEEPVWRLEPTEAPAPPPETENEQQIRQWREQMQPVGDLLGIRSGT